LSLHPEPANLRARLLPLTAGQTRPDSAIWLCDGTANVTFCGWSCPGFARGPAIGAGRSARRRRQAGWVQDVCPSQTG
jgi:hypothetical protein